MSIQFKVAIREYIRNTSTRTSETDSTAIERLRKIAGASSIGMDDDVNPKLNERFKLLGPLADRLCFVELGGCFGIR